MNAIGYIFDGGSGRALSGKAVSVARHLMTNAGKIQTRDEIARACDFEPNGRSCDTYISDIRNALGRPLQNRVASCPSVGYAWMGDPIDIIECVKECVKKKDETLAIKASSCAVMTLQSVAKRLGISVSAVQQIEKRALKKLQKNRDLIDAWKKLKHELGSVSYDPFHQIWLYSVSQGKPNDNR